MNGSTHSNVPNRETIEAIASVYSSLGYLRFRNALQMQLLSDAAERRMKELGDSDRVRELAQVSERIGAAIAAGGPIPEWLQQRQSELIQELAEELGQDRD